MFIFETIQIAFNRCLATQHINQAVAFNFSNKFYELSLAINNYWKQIKNDAEARDVWYVMDRTHSKRTADLFHVTITLLSMSSLLVIWYFEKNKKNETHTRKQQWRRRRDTSREKIYNEIT